jgi:hypothetical protein
MFCTLVDDSFIKYDVRIMKTTKAIISTKSWLGVLIVSNGSLSLSGPSGIWDNGEWLDENDRARENPYFKYVPHCSFIGDN